MNRIILGEFASHRKGDRGKEETGWILLGHRTEREAVVLATLPAGSRRDAGVAHVRFNTTAQALAGRIVRQWDKRLTTLGVLHTHPGSLRHPSSGDYRGDSQWVGQLKGKEGVFGIGTADGTPSGTFEVASHPKKHVQQMGELCLSWYALGEGERKYRPLEMDLTLGPDLAFPLRPLWSIIEMHAPQLERLVLQQQRVRFDVIKLGGSPCLSVSVPLAEASNEIRVLFTEKGPQYYVVRGPELIGVDPNESHVDSVVYMILAKLSNSS
ncbi:MAG: Mov34/MPN/PAD-1 family protein [Gemmataceae bacterium]